jgi:hypothetical protein
MVLPLIPLWVIIVVIALVFIMFLIRSSNNINVLTFIKRNFFYFFVVLFLAIFVISMINITLSHDFDLATLKGWGSAFKIYLNWFVGVFKNIVKVTGYAIQQDWIASGNSTG